MPKILDRLVRQLRSRGVKSPYGMATSILQKNGILKKGTRSLTPKGKKRNSMSPGQRAKSRAAKASGRSPSSYRYNKKTNRARLKKRA